MRVAQISLPLDSGRFVGHFKALGNRHLLERPIHQVQCSRRYFAYERIPKRGGGLVFVGAAVAERRTGRAAGGWRA